MFIITSIYLSNISKIKNINWYSKHRVDHGDYFTIFSLWNGVPIARKEVDIMGAYSSSFGGTIKIRNICSHESLPTLGLLSLTG